jgi:hypothetical protein
MIPRRDRPHPNKARKQRVLASVMPRLEALDIPEWALARLRSVHFSSDRLEAIEAVLDAQEKQHEEKANETDRCHRPRAQGAAR